MGSAHAVYFYGHDLRGQLNARAAGDFKPTHYYIYCYRCQMRQRLVHQRTHTLRVVRLTRGDRDTTPTRHKLRLLSRLDDTLWYTLTFITHNSLTMYRMETHARATHVHLS